MAPRPRHRKRESAAIAEPATNAGQELLARALCGAANPAFITDALGNIVWVNQAFSGLYGYSPAQAIGQTPRLLQSGKHGARYYRAIWSALRKGRTWAGETIDRASDGRLFTVRQTISPLWQDGEITHYLSIHADMSREAETEAIGQLKRGSDEITGLWTTARFEARGSEVLESARAAQRRAALLLITVEHRCGGAIVRTARSTAFLREVVGERIRRAVGREAAVGVLGDFDFGVLISGSEPGIETTREKLSANMRQPVGLFGDTLSLECRSALAWFPDDGQTIDALRRAADLRLDREQNPPAPRAVPARPGHPVDVAIERD